MHCSQFLTHPKLNNLVFFPNTLCGEGEGIEEEKREVILKINLNKI